MVVEEGRSGSVGPRSSVAGFQPQGGKGSGGELGLRQTALPSKGSGGWLGAGRWTSVYSSQP